MSRGSMPTNGVAVRYHRQVAGLTLTALAAKAEVSVSYLSKIENGTNARPPVLKRIADVLGLSVRDLMPEGDRLPLIA